MQIETLCYGDYTAQVNVSKGGNCISLRNSRYDCKIIREPNYDEGLESPYLYGMPILFPVNRISGGRFEFEGRTYVFPINEEDTNCFLHGTLHETAFEVLEQEMHRISLSYKATRDKPYLTFPHEFEIRLEYILNDEGLLHKTEIYNSSNQNMPVFLGFHTAFSLPFVDGSRIEDVLIMADIAKEYERDMTVYLPTGKLLEYDDESKKLAEGRYVPEGPISRHYHRGTNGKMSVTDQKKGLSIIYENDPELAYRLIYGKGTDFICMEPQTCLANCANAPFPREETGFAYVKPGEKKTFWSKIGVKSLV